MNDKGLVDRFWPLDPEAAEDREILAACLARVDGERSGTHAENLTRRDRAKVCGSEELSSP